MTSRQIAELTGRHHKNVLRDCDQINQDCKDEGMAQIRAVKYKSPNGQQYREMVLTKMQWEDLIIQYL